MDKQRATQLLALIRTKQADLAAAPAGLAPSPLAAADNAAGLHARSEALKRLGGFALASVGLGAGARGLVGLLNQVRGDEPSVSGGGPTMMSLPYPVDPAIAPESVHGQKRRKQAGLLDWATTGSTVQGIPAYMPAAVLTTLGGGIAGWKGVDAILDARRKKERDAELDKARQEFHGALISQYDKPLANKAASATSKIAADLDRLYDLFEAQMSRVKQAGLGDMVSSMVNSDTAKQIAGGYGVYAGLSGLLTGAMVYNKAKKRSREAIIQKALQRRQREQFAQSPTAIYATPEPVAHIPQPNFKNEMHDLEVPTPGEATGA